MGEAYFFGTHYAHHGEQDEGEKGGDSQGQGLDTPEDRHEDDGVATVGCLRVGGERQSFWTGQACIPKSSPPACGENRPFVTM